jgi:hypothetical protein
LGEQPRLGNRAGLLSLAAPDHGETSCCTNMAWVCKARAPTMKYLTREQQKVLCVILFLLLTGLAVKTWRTAHPPKQATQQR